jgi:hypothetical protein
LSLASLTSVPAALFAPAVDVGLPVGLSFERPQTGCLKAPDRVTPEHGSKEPIQE